MPFTYLKSRRIDTGRWILANAMFSKDSSSRKSPQKGHFMEGSHWGSNTYSNFRKLGQETAATGCSKNRSYAGRGFRDEHSKSDDTSKVLSSFWASEPTFGEVNYQRDVGTEHIHLQRSKTRKTEMLIFLRFWDPSGPTLAIGRRFGRATVERNENHTFFSKKSSPV